MKSEVKPKLQDIVNRAKTLTGDSDVRVRYSAYSMLVQLGTDMAVSAWFVHHVETGGL